MIEFVVFTGGNVTGQAELRFGLAGNAFANTELSLGGGLELTLAGEAVGEVYTTAADPPLPANADGALYLDFDAVGYTLIVGEADGYIPLAIDAGPSGYADLRFDVAVDASAQATIEAYGMLVMAPPQIMAYTGLSFARVDEDMSINLSPTAQLIHVITERMLLSDNVRPLAALLASVSEQFRLTDRGVPLFLAAIRDGLDLGDELQYEAQMIARVVDRLMLQDDSIGFLDALVMVVSSMALRDRLTPIAQGEMVDDLQIDSALVEKITALVEYASELVIAADPEFSAVVFAAVKDSLTVGDDAQALLALLAEVFDSLDFAVRLRVGDEIFVGYSVNLKNTAVTEYDNYPFNALAIIGGRPFGTSDEGLFRLEGDTDDETPIRALVRTGLTEFPELVRVANAWIVMTANGEILFKTINGDEGDYEVATYRMHARPQGTAVETRFDLDKGYVGTAWGFELENVDGAYFELDSARFWPVTVGRRYSGR